MAPHAAVPSSSSPHTRFPSAHFDCLPGAVSLAELKEAVVGVYQERKNLALTLRDTKNVISKLEGLIGGVIHVMWVFFYLAIFNVDVTKASASAADMHIGMA